MRQWSSRNLPARAAFRAETGLVGSRGVHHQCLSRSGLSSLAAASGLSFPASGYGQCCIRICLYLNPPPALKSQNWRYRLGRSRCMQNAFVALARYRDNMERPHRFQSELPKVIAKTMSALPPKADIRRCKWNVRLVPIADIRTTLALNQQNTHPATIRTAKGKRPAKTHQPFVSAASHVRTGKGVKSCSSTAATTITTT